ncbi:hypothetical protein CCS01_14940 [Rhodopila globiformis]|uniref:Transposase DDE domain-containing protein n=1 Tax=Rhodopila globiformis TaxID=1071 RepID=A0A2S6NER3_RHOGL|nr:hypothetical protein CCS01_14940 [Rhodopila globiformis]
MSTQAGRTGCSAARCAPTWAIIEFDGQAEDLIKLHKAQPASDRTNRREPVANQACTRWLTRPSAAVRRILDTAAYWLVLRIRDAIPSQQSLATAEFTTRRLHLIKIGACITETATAPCPVCSCLATKQARWIIIAPSAHQQSLRHGW